jgi:hypothetical protein
LCVERRNSFALLLLSSCWEVSNNFMTILLLTSNVRKQTVLNQFHCCEYIYIYIVQWYSKSAPWTTIGPQKKLEWSANPNLYLYFVLHRPPNYSKWSAQQKSLGTTDIVCQSFRLNLSKQWDDHLYVTFDHTWSE